MGRRIGIAVCVVGAAACVTLGLVRWLPTDPNEIRDGNAFGGGEGTSYEIGMPSVLAGEDVWYLAPAPTNRSSKTVTLEEIQPGTLPDGMAFVDARILRKDAFVAGVPLSWDTGASTVDDPSTKPSRGVQGYQLLPGQALPDDDLIYMHFRVTTSHRPLETHGVKVIYRQDGKKYAEVLGASLKLFTPTPRQG